MNRGFDRSVGAAVVTAVFAGIAGVVGSYALAGYTQSFVAAPVTSFVTQHSPGFLLQIAIGPLTTIGEKFGIQHLGQQANLVLAIALVVVVFAVLSLVALVVSRRIGGMGGLDDSLIAVGLAGVLVWVVTAAITGAPVTALGAGIASGLVVAVAVFAAAAGGTNDPVSGGRREVLGSFATALGVGVVGYLVGGRGSGPTQPTSLSGVSGSNGTGNASGSTNASGSKGASANETGNASANGGNDPSAIQHSLAEAKTKSLGVDGLKGLVSGNSFYQVDIDNVNPSVNADDWSLSVTGAVKNEQTFSYDDITSMKRTSVFKTLRCVSDHLNGNDMDNALWSGVPMKQVLERAKPQGKFVMLRAADNYYEEFPVAALEQGFLAYGMDGDVLPEKHGYPVRALIPGHWGEINVKWVKEIQVLDRPAKGFWEKKGWHGTGPVNTVAKIHATNHLDNGKVQAAGHAYAGTRGIKRVEVSTDGGNSWNDAELSKKLSPTLAGDVWRQWVYTYKPPSGKHEAIARAVDDSGTTQAKKSTNAYPSGASGWVSETIGG